MTGVTVQSETNISGGVSTVVSAPFEGAVVAWLYKK